MFCTFFIILYDVWAGIKISISCHVITNELMKYAITNDIIKYAIKNDVINKKINNNFMFPNTPCATHAR